MVASDYGLLDERTSAPNCWESLLWRKLIGTTVLESGVPIRAGLHAYARRRRGTPGGVALLVINTDKATSQTLSLPSSAERYTLSSNNLEDAQVRLNETELKLGGNDELPPIAGTATVSGNVTFAPATITFLALASAGNNACQ